MDKMIAYCGFNCNKCDVFIATKNDDNELRKKTASQWSNLNGVTITEEMINCEGCIPDGKKIPFCQSICEIRKCAIANNFDSCGLCSTLDSCKTISVVKDTNPQAWKNLEEAKKQN